MLSTLIVNVGIAVQGEAGAEPNDLDVEQGDRVRDTKRWCKACDRVHDLSLPAASAVNGMQHVKNPGQEAPAAACASHALAVAAPSITKGSPLLHSLT